jgi:parallel beta-helix repeat protein
MGERYGILIIGTVILLLCFVGTASARTWYVDDSGGADFIAIQEAIIAASGGDTIVVKDGNYLENVKVTKCLTIRSDSGPNSTRVWAYDQGDFIFDVTADHVNISGFMFDNAWVGIQLNSADCCDVYDNEFNKCGIEIHNSNNTRIFNNDNCSSIKLYNSNNSSIFNGDDDIYIRDSNNNIIFNHSDSYAAIYLFSSNNNSIFNNDVGNIKLSGSDNTTISNNTCSYTDDGIHLSHSNNNSICNNKCSVGWGASEWKYGISLDYSHYNNISDNNCSINAGGIMLTNSKSNSVSNNKCSDNRDFGILLDRSSFYNEISNNSCLYSGLTRYTRAGRGISIPGSYNNILYNNCSRLDDGIYITGSYNNVSNNICSNSEYGIYSKSRNRIYLNNFINNIRGNVKSSTNTWNSPEKISYTYHEAHFTNYLGNYWDDYEGIDEDGNGLGDTPYQIDKSEGDLFPLMERFENYIVEVEEPTEFLVAGSNPSGAYICSDP